MYDSLPLIYFDYGEVGLSIIMRGSIPINGHGIPLEWAPQSEKLRIDITITNASEED